MDTPNQGRLPSHIPRARLARMAACARLLSAFPHSHRTQTSVRSPLVPRSSMKSWRCCWAQSEGPLCVNEYQSISPMCPARQARTNRIGTTDRRFLSPTARQGQSIARCRIGRRNLTSAAERILLVGINSSRRGRYRRNSEVVSGHTVHRG